MQHIYLATKRREAHEEQTAHRRDLPTAAKTTDRETRLESPAKVEADGRGSSGSRPRHRCPQGDLSASVVGQLTSNDLIGLSKAGTTIISAGFADLFPELVAPLLKDTNKDGIKSRTGNFNKRKTSFHRNPQRKDENDHENDLVLPTVQPPLMLPKPDGMTEQRF